ncbi:MAG: carboxypeptidase regulatory-like domain-containing protein [Candidatus Binatia bacterium]
MRWVTRAALLGILGVHVAPAQAGTVEGTVSVNGLPAVRAVIVLEGPAAAAPAAPRPQVVMDQRNLAFVPGVLPVLRGTIIEFTNSDDVQHNVFSPSAAARKFNLGTYGPGAAGAVKLDTTGEVVVLCNIHMEMEARILVLDTPYFSTVGRDGHFRIADVPPGTYAVRVWQERWLPTVQTLQVPETEGLTVNVVTEK